MTRDQCVSTALNSSMLVAATYASDGILELAFRNRTIYRYFAVPPAIFLDLIAAPSQGAYFNRNIRNRFRYQRVA